MTKLYAEVYKLKAGAEHAAHIARSYGQPEAKLVWETQAMAFNLILKMLGDSEITPSRWKRFICKIFHQKHSLKCANCGGSL